MKNIVRLILLLSCYLSLNLSAEEMQTCTILALGDSITEGSRSAANYRPYLIKLLSAENKDYKFIGPKKDHTSHHAGYSGRNSSHLRSVITRLYRSHPAEIVLIHTGHNHFAKNKPINTILADNKAIVKAIQKINPNAKILLATIIPSGKLPKYSYIPDLNKELKKFIKSTAGVFLVDQAQDFVWEKDTVKDKVHPNSEGAKKMAKKWFQQIQNLAQGLKANTLIDELPENEKIALDHASKVIPL